MLGLIPALVAAVLYTATASYVPVPGESARMLYQHSGLDPFPSLLHPLWNAAMHWIAKLGGNIAFNASIFSALCSTLTVFLVYELMSRARIRYLRSNEAPDTGSFCGLAAACYLIGSVPFWTISTRAHPAALHLLLLAATLTLLGRLRQTGDGRTLVLFALLLGLAAAEYPAMWLLAPPMAVVAALHAYRSRRISARQIGLALAAAVAGLLLNAVAAWRFLTHPAQAYLGGFTFSEALASVLREQSRQLLQVSGDVGWLLIAMFAVIPWLLAFLAAQQTPITEEPKGSSLVYGLLTLMAAVQLIPSRFTPFLAFQERGIILAAPYFLVAAYFGYAMAYWYSRIAIESRHVRRAGPDPAWWLALPCIGLLAVAASLNYPWIDTRPAGVLYQWVQQVVRIVPEGTWLVTHGQIDDLLALASHQAGSNQRTLNMARSDDEPYRLYLATQLNSPPLQELARVSLGACVARWAQTEPIDSLAFLDSPDSWRRAGLNALPHLGLYRGVESVEAVARRRLLEDHRAFWDSVLTPLAKVQERTDYTGSLAGRLLRHSAKVANDLGVLMDELGEAGMALEAYQAALAADPGNSSALFNRFDLLARLGQTEEGLRVWERLARLLSALQSSHAMEDALARYGQIRHPLWAQSLVWALGASDTASVPADRLAAVAGAYAAGNFSLAGPMAARLTADYPQSVHAGTLRGILAYLQGAEQEVEEVITAMDMANLDWSPLPHILGHLAAARNRTDESRAFWQRALTRRPADVALLEDLIDLHVQAPTTFDPEEAGKYLTRLITLDPDNPAGNYAAGRDHFEHGRLDASVDAFQRSLRRSSSGLDVPYWLAAALQRLGRSTEALPLARRALDQNPSHPEAQLLLSQVLASVGSSLRLEDTTLAERPPVQVASAQPSGPTDLKDRARFPDQQSPLPPPRLIEDIPGPELADIATAAPPTEVAEPAPAPQPEPAAEPAPPAAPSEEPPEATPQTPEAAEAPLKDRPAPTPLAPAQPMETERPFVEAEAQRPLDW